ncbi:autoinducer binding domain-containing protein [Microvirga sp. 2MCAF35]|uniref:helix-turn-helix transcriptional regulator n=1 Tax=Microvirga sp. 2MCAF35 TaxID=3232987 RepID=UPI003F95142D
MTRNVFEKTVEFIRNLDGARSPAEVCEMLLASVSQFGAEYVLAGIIPGPGTSRQQQVSSVVLDHWPKDWSLRYFSHGYIFRDPTIRSVQTSPASFLWSELEPICRSDTYAWRVMDEAGDFKLRQGFTIPLTTLDGDVAGFSIAGERLEISPEDRGVLTLLATYALGRSILLREEDRSTITLTPRERETLQWAAEGKSEWEIGERMGISEHGVDKHMRSAREKLGTRTRTHAVAEAIRLRLIK